MKGIETIKQLTKTQSIFIALGMFLAVILSLIFIATPVQANFGMLGVLITELILLALAIGGVLLTKGNFKEIFPLKKPALRQTFATIILWLASYILVLFSTILIGYFFPEGVTGTSSALNDFMSTIPFWARFLIVAVSPVICEEAIHRGFILHYLKPIQKKWLIVLIMGILFGIFHLDPIRFLATALLGAIITYVAIETENMFYPFLIHFINNAISVFATKATEGVEMTQETYEAALSLSSVGIYLILLCVTPWLLWLGITLLHPKKEKIEGVKTGTWKKVLLCSGISAFCIIGGFVLSAVGLAQSAVMNVSKVETLSDLSETPFTYDFEVEEAKKHMLTAVLSTPEGLLELVITDENGTVVHESSAASFTGNIPLDLEAGSYHLEVRYVNEDGALSPSAEAVATFNLIMQKL